MVCSKKITPSRRPRTLKTTNSKQIPKFFNSRTTRLGVVKVNDEREEWDNESGERGKPGVTNFAIERSIFKLH